MMLWQFIRAGGNDYQLMTTNLIFQVGSSEERIEIQIYQDFLVEETEVFNVRIFVQEQPFPVGLSTEEAMVLIEDNNGQLLTWITLLV